MDKANVIKALEICAEPNGICEGCPYIDKEDCSDCVKNDAIALLKESTKETQDDSPVYTKACIFTKTENLVKYFNGHEPSLPENTFNRYLQPREIQLILLVRYEEGKCICRIKCPINPLPIKGEFVTVSPGAVGSLLSTLGWKFKEALPLNLFK